MAGLSSAGEAAVLTPLTTSAFVSLHTADPGDAGASEVSGNGYARQSATFANAGANPTVASNSVIITWPAATGPGWGTITYFGIWDQQLAGGNFRGSGAVTTPKPINPGDTARFTAGALTITVN